MLVVSRKVGETICIADNIHVTVSEVRSGRVRICIDAPRSIRVMRQERILDVSAGSPMTADDSSAPNT
jgi:carbon storage regulator